jgi:hypothetical protein
MVRALAMVHPSASSRLHGECARSLISSCPSALSLSLCLDDAGLFHSVRLLTAYSCPSVKFDHIFGGHDEDSRRPVYRELNVLQIKNIRRGGKPL